MNRRAGKLIEAGLWLRLSGDLEGARRLFRQALKLDPSNERAKTLLAAAQPAEAMALPQSLPEEEARRDGDPDALEAVERSLVSGWELEGPPGVELGSPEDKGALIELVGADQPSASPAPVRAPPAARATEVQQLIDKARRRIELDEHSAALEFIEQAIALAPDDPELGVLKQRSEAIALAMYESKLGALDARPVVIMGLDSIIWLRLDHRAGFVLAQIDGTVSFEELFSVSGMSRLDTARILAQLVTERVIAPR